MAALQKPPWTRPLNWSLQLTRDGEERIPFGLYIRSNDEQPRSSSQLLFQDFHRLPTELQLRVLAFCSPPTLYQMMRTSMLRTEATKVLWADPSVYYLIEGPWLCSGGHLGCTSYDASFMAHVQNAEIEFDVRTNNHVLVFDSNTSLIDGEKVRHFWETFQKRFPRAKRVLVNQNWDSWTRQLQPRPDDHERGPCSLTALIKACPAEIDILAYLLVKVEPEPCIPRKASNWRRVYYQFSDDGGWKEVQTSVVERKTVLMPLKRFLGLVGEWEALMYEGNKIDLLLKGLGALAVESLDRHQFNKEVVEPFHCPISGCDTYLEKAGQWMQHAAEGHPFDWVFESRFELLPDNLQCVFAERKNELEQRMEAARVKVRRVHHDWNEGGAEKRREIERAWIYQMENDEAWETGTKPLESELWEQFLLLMEGTV